MPGLCLCAGVLPLGVELTAWARIRKCFLHLLWKCWITEQSSTLQQNGTDRGCKGWGDTSGIRKVAGVWMWCNYHYFGVKMTSLNRDTSEGHRFWCIKPHSLSISRSEGIHTGQWAQGSSSHCRSLLGTRSSVTVALNAQPHVSDLSASGFQGCVKLKAEKT